MAITLDGSTGITTPTYGGSVSAEYITPVTGFKNRIINGDMMFDQRNAGASMTSGVSTYSLDRWMAFSNVSSKYTAQQNAGSVTPPEGFTNYLGCTSLSAHTLGATDVFILRQFIEGYNIADLMFGTTEASSVTLSFWVRSSLTGDFGGCLQNDNALSDRSYPFNYSIPVANTWTKINITVDGDTTGTWRTNNAAGLTVCFGLGVGSTYSGTAGSWTATNYLSATGATSVVGTSGATFYITGVQLEKGTTATSFDNRSIGQELSLCQRYYYKALVPMGSTLNSTITYNMIVTLPVSMRATPTLAAGASFIPSLGSAGTPLLSVGTGYLPSPSLNAMMVINSASNWTVGYPVVLNAGFNSEL